MRVEFGGKSKTIELNHLQLNYSTTLKTALQKEALKNVRRIPLRNLHCSKRDNQPSDEATLFKSRKFCRF